MCIRDRVSRLLSVGLPFPAYEYVLKASHAFNLLDSRRAISVTERQRYILRVRGISKEVAKSYFESRRKAGFPLADDETRKFVLKEPKNA